MAFIWKSIDENYEYYMHDVADPLTKDWLLIPSPLPLTIILFTYNIFCSKLGPKFMKNRPAYDLKTIIRLYNIFQVFISVYIVYELYIYTFLGDFHFQCQAKHEGQERVARAIQVYFISKLIELLDTIFFVLRKSDRQITFLHLFHHTIMPIFTWIGLKYYPGGQGILIAEINSVVHVFMYIYYFISGLGPQYQKYLWWKRYLTVVQIVQFFLVFLQNFISLFYDCNYPLVLKLMGIVFANFFIFLFSKFYYITYIVKHNKYQKDDTMNKTQHFVKND